MLRSARFAQHGLGGKTREISSIVKQATTELIKASPLISKYFKITRDKITCTLNECTLKAFAGESNNINGLLLTSFIVDEVANQETQDIIGALKLSQMSVKGSRLSIYISTQYDLEINAFNELIDYHKKVLDGLTDTEPLNMFGLLFELDAGDDYTDPQNWWKASPLQMGFENGRKFLMGEFKKGLEVPSTMREFRIKILNQRLSGDTSESFVPLEDLRQGLLEEAFDWNKKEVYWGVDLSVSDDSCSISMVHYDEAEDKFYIKAWAFVPHDTLAQRIKLEKIDYHRMIENGYCFSCGDRIISYQFIEDFLISISKRYNLRVKGIGYDRFNAISSANRWSSEGLETIEVRQHSTILNGGTKLMKESILQHKFYYERNRLLENHFINARTMYDTNLNQYINKKRSRGKIDMVAATLNAFVLWNKEKEQGTSIYETRDLVIL